MSFIDKILDSLYHRKEFKNEFHNVNYAATKKQLMALQVQLPVLIDEVDKLKFELRHLITDNRYSEALKKFQNDRSNERPYLKLVQEFHDIIKSFCSKAFYRKKDAHDTFLLLVQNNGVLMHDNANIDVRLKALKNVLEDKIFGRLEYLASNNANFMNYEEALIFKQDIEDLDHNLRLVKNAMFDIRNKDNHLWLEQMGRITRKEKVPESERYF